MDYLKQKMPIISEFLANYLQEMDKTYQEVNRWGRDVFYRLNQFCQGGKMLRGALVFLASEMWKAKFNKRMNQNALKIAAAMELFQATFLIQDDFMDRDSTRRGNPSVYEQYRQLGRDHEITAADHFGDSLAVCCSDISLFAANRLIAQLEMEPAAHLRIMDSVNKEYIQVGLAQMEDVYLGNRSSGYDESDILNIYLYKTARYTFSLPMMLGAINASRSEDEIKKLSDWGEFLGIIFQVKDDELGIFADEKELGKPLGSDIIEGKKTIYYYHLMERAEDKDKKRLEKLFGNPKLSAGDMDFIRDLIQKLGIDTKIRKRSERLADSARNVVDGLDLNDQGREIMLQLIDYSLERKY